MLSTISTVGGIVDGRAEALPLTDSLQKLPDYYSALRNVVAEHRAAYVADGKQGSPENSPFNAQEHRPMVSESLTLQQRVIRDDSANRHLHCREIILRLSPDCRQLVLTRYTDTTARRWYAG